MKNVRYFSLNITFIYFVCFSTVFSPTINQAYATTSNPIDWICPESYDGYIRHPHNCQLYYQCNSTGIPTLLSCSIVHYFNPVADQCEPQSDVPDCLGGTPPPTTTTPISTTKSDPIDWICPENYQGLIRNPFDCQSFYLCNVRETPYFLECPCGLYFNPGTQRCDFPENVPDCLGGSPPPVTPTPRLSTTTIVPQTTNDPIEWICPDSYEGYIRHPYLCQLFYECHLNSTPRLYECISNNYFSPITERCELPSEVSDCEGGSPAPITPTSRPSTI